MQKSSDVVVRESCEPNLTEKGLLDMRNIFARMKFVVTPLLGLLLCVSAATAQEAKFDSDTISGLGARNIGSATMSGRVSAVAAVKEEGRITVYIGAASGGVWKSTNGGTPYKPVFDKTTA